MCGFNGCFFLNKKCVKNKFNPLPLNHRGPDDYKSFKRDFLKINFFRLRILGGSLGEQPMVSENKNWMIVFNGEIYNYIELAKEIKRPDLIKKGDTRVLIELISLKGLSSINKLNGMFSIALLNLKNKKLYLIRDRFGIKPLYYKIDKDTLYFSSEIKCIPLDTKDKINYKKIDDFLNSELYPRSPKTFFNNIYEIQPGTINQIKSNKLLSKKYYNLEKEIKKKSKANINLDDFEKALENSIKLRLRSDVPISLHFSGGVDSTAIICKLKEMYNNKIPLKLFFLNYLKKNNYEINRAKKISNLLGLKLNIINFNGKEVKKLSNQIQYFMDEPFGGIPVLGMGQLNKSQKKKIPVSLEGQGSDEIFGGYYTHTLMAMRDLINQKNGKKILSKLKKNFKIDNKKIIEITNLLLKNNFGGSTDAEKILWSNDNVKWGGSYLKTIELFNIKNNKLPRVLRFHDRVSAAYSRELRFPFLDHNVVEIALSLKILDKFKDGYPKYPLHRIIERHLPIKMFKEKKRSSNVPEKKILFMNKDWIIKNIEKLKKLKKIKNKYFLNFYNNFHRKKKINSFHIWQLININLFINHYKKLNN